MPDLQKPSDLRRVVMAVAASPGGVVFALAVAGAAGFYAWRILDGARRVTDWLLIAPVAGVAIAALLFAVVGDLRAALSPPSSTNAPEPAPEVASKPVGAASDRWQLSPDQTGFALMVLVLVYAMALPWIGFDVGTVVFVATALVLQGERRWGRLIVTALIAAGLFVYVFKALLGVRLPTLLM